jgi:photosynthetic reaction center L subunit
VSWALREVEICRKLGMGYHVPFAFALRSGLHDAHRHPARADGRLGARFPYGIFSHLEWVSNNVGYAYLQLPLQPGPHAGGDLLLHHRRWRLRCMAV